MDSSRERDQSVERLLRQSFPASRTDVTDQCLDAETLAAWVDGGLSGRALEMAESHVANCDRCQMLVGTMVQTHVIEPHPQSAPRRWIPWLVPVAAAAAVVTLWVAMPRESRAPVAPALPPATEERQQRLETTAEQSRGPENRPQASPGGRTRQAPQRAAAKAESEAGVNAELSKEAGRVDGNAVNRQERSFQAPAAESRAAEPPAAPPPAPVTSPSVRAGSAARAYGTLADTLAVASEIASPDPAVRWRIGGRGVEHSTNGGATWENLATGVSTPLTAGAAPSATICWLVGRGGIVLLSTDGRAFRRIPFVEITDLSAVQASSATTASVSTVDGRTFSTNDGGLTWSRRD